MLTAIGDVMRKCYERGWITVRDGNISLRKSLDGNISPYMYITPSGVRKTAIHPEHIIKLYMADGFAVYPNNMNGKPSGELEMHRLLQEDAKTSRAIVHVHATHIVAAIHAGIDLQEIAREFPEISRYTKVGPTVPALPAVSKELAESTNLAMRNGDPQNRIEFDIVGQANHGVCAIGRDPWHAYEHIERLDHICQIVLLAKK